MDTFKVGDTVRVLEGDVMKGTVGTLVSWNDRKQKWLVRVADIQQNWVGPEHLEIITLRGRRA